MMDNHDPDDAVVESLLGVQHTADSDSLRQSLLVRTTQVLRRRRRFKHLGYGLALAACYVAGLGTMRLLSADTDKSSPRVSDAPIAERMPDPSPSPDRQSVVSVVLPLEQDPEAPAGVLERVAALSKDNQSVLYRRAGDRYLEDEGNMQAALRCYARSLDTGKANDLAIAEEDNWLLIELKKSRLEGKNHAQTGG